MLEQEQIKLLDPQQAERLRAFEVLFETPGWKFFIEEVQAVAAATQFAVLNANDWETNRMQTGRLRVLTDILQYEEQKAAEFLSYYEDKAADIADEDVDAELDFE